MSSVQIVTAVSASDSTTPVKSADAVCTGGRVAIGGGGAVVMDGSNEDVGMDVLGPIDDVGTLGAGNAGWRAQATNFFIDSSINWAVRAYAICAIVQ
jgi:hypothetical protein